jgi:hypothetical protein
MPRTEPAKRSLVNCIQLETSDTKHRPETMAEKLERRTAIQRYRAAKKYLHKELKESLGIVAVRNKSEGLAADLAGVDLGDKGSWSAARDYRRVDACQSEWVGFRATCCSSKAIAVPIGCNHRLCPLCNAVRLEKYRSKAREILGAMQYPTFLTLTVPNKAKLTRHTYRELRSFWKEFYRRNKSLLGGGVYSIETTYNREDGSWHPHIHIVFDAPWPTRGIKKPMFILLKRQIEFLWLRITSPQARKAYRRGEFERWNQDLTQFSQGSEWNQKFRRVIDIRPVKSESGAVYELLKYISKTNRFLDVPEAVEGYLRAVRGVRVIQTFGKFYNIKFEEPLSQNDLEAMAAMGIEAPLQGAVSYFHCDCGQNKFKGIGFFSMHDVEMDEKGHWFVKHGFEDKGRWSNRQLHERLKCRGSSTRRERGWHLSNEK